MKQVAATDHPAMLELRSAIAQRAQELGFQAIGVAGIDLGEDEARLRDWLDSGYHGELGYMQRHGSRRSRPAELVPGTLRVISARMDYWPQTAADPIELLEDPTRGYVSRYALGRDYHKVLRRALTRLARHIDELAGAQGHRVFVDSAPVLEKALARNAGLGFIGKHTNLINTTAGSWFFLGEIFTTLPLPIDARASAHCGSCSACLPACPTAAIVAPYQLDARRCISYLTIELKGSIPVELRPLIGNRIYGCDDCQLVCPWNKFARAATHPDIKVRHGLDRPRLIELLGWSAEKFDRLMRGTAIYRLGYQRWQRNIAVALGNAPPSDDIIRALRSSLDGASPMVREHLQWALERQES
ncbi:MAG: tRNA epoxyqueuosine(34) reductase QueG [Steroidobacteraceae bacterium]